MVCEHGVVFMDKRWVATLSEILFLMESTFEFVRENVPFTLKKSGATDAYKN